MRRMRTGSLDDGVKINGVDHIDVDRLKQEILSEIRKEMNKMKLDIIEGKRWTVGSLVFKNASSCSLIFQTGRKNSADLMPMIIHEASS